MDNRLFWGDEELRRLKNWRARRWNHANVLALSLRLPSEIVARKILDAWFSAPEEGGDDAACVARVER